MICRRADLRIFTFFSFASLLLVALIVGLTVAPVCAAQDVPAPRVVDLKAADGTSLKATYFAAAKPGPGVLLLHQCNAQRKVWNGLATSLAGAGINVLTFDFRGFGESDGKNADQFTAQEALDSVNKIMPSDADVAFAYLESQPGVMREVMGAGGASCGVNQAVQLARRHPKVKSLVLLSEGTNPEGRKFLRASPNLPLFVAAAYDDPDPGVVEIMEWLAGLSPDPANKVVSYPTGGHGYQMFDAHKELPGMIVDWFVTTLKPSPGATAAATPAAARAPMSAEVHFLELTDEPDGGNKAREMYKETTRNNSNTDLFSEALLNRIGYEHLQQQGDVKGAITLFEINVMRYPNSANVYDSLGDAYMVDGQKELARQNSKKAIEMLPSNTSYNAATRDAIKANAEQKLKALGDTAAK
jgi:dienelactone hydrolase